MRIRITAAVAIALLIMAGCSSSAVKPALTPVEPGPVSTETSPVATGEVSPTTHSQTENIPEPEEQWKEAVLPTASFTPTMLLVLAKPGVHPPGDIYGYNQATGQLIRLTEMVNSPLGAGSMMPSPGGHWFAYTRVLGQADGVAGYCVRSTVGGENFCRWGLNFAPSVWKGPNQLTVWEGKWISLDLSHGLNRITIQPDSEPLTVPSPDQEWAFQLGKEKVSITAASDSRALVDIPIARILDAKWLDSNHILVLQGIEGLSPRGTLSIVDTEGNVQKIGGVQISEEKLAQPIENVVPDPTGRLISANFSSFSPTYHHVGTALYDVRQATWTRVPGDTPRAIAWVQGQLLVSDRNGWFVFDPLSDHRRQLALNPNVYFLGTAPDGNWLAFQTRDNTDPAWSLYLCRLSSGESFQVDTGEKWVFDAKWVPTFTR